MMSTSAEKPKISNVSEANNSISMYYHKIQERPTDTQTDTQTHRQIHRQIHRQADRQIHRQTHTHTEADR